MGMTLNFAICVNKKRVLEETASQEREAWTDFAEDMSLSFSCSLMIKKVGVVERAEHHTDLRLSLHTCSLANKENITI